MNNEHHIGILIVEFAASLSVWSAVALAAAALIIMMATAIIYGKKYKFAGFGRILQRTGSLLMLSSCTSAAMALVMISCLTLAYMSLGQAIITSITLLWTL